MRRPSRRAVLGTALGVGLGTASGCLGTAGEPSAGVEPISLGTAQTLDGRSVTVSDVAVRDAVLYFETPESLAVASREGERYVVASVTSETGGPSADAFGLRVGGSDTNGRSRVSTSAVVPTTSTRRTAPERVD
jgi:hypothetical protein